MHGHDVMYPYFTDTMPQSTAISNKSYAEYKLSCYGLHEGCPEGEPAVTLYIPIGAKGRCSIRRDP